jgi:multidrug resistance efflux pump
MRPYSFVHSAALSIAAFLGLAVATALPAWSADFSDRDLLEDVLTLDEQASLADAEESAAEAEAELADALAELAAAQDQLDAASMDLADAQAELMDAQAAASDAADAVAQAQMDVDTAQALLDQGIVDGLPQPELDLLEAAVSKLVPRVTRKTQKQPCSSPADRTPCTTSACHARREPASTSVERVRVCGFWSTVRTSGRCRRNSGS